MLFTKVSLNSQILLESNSENIRPHSEVQTVKNAVQIYPQDTILEPVYFYDFGFRGSPLHFLILAQK